MAHAKNKQTDPLEDRRRWIAFGILAAVAAGTLMLGASLSTSAPGGPPGVAEPLSEPDFDGGEFESAIAIPPAASGLSDAPTAMDRLARRTASDLERMALEPRAWTSQLAVLCDTARVEAVLESTQYSPSLSLLPAYVDDRSCFRLCWGRYDNREQARARADLPDLLRQDFPTSYPRLRSEVLE